MENFKIKNKFFFEAGGKREAGGDDKLTFFYGALHLGIMFTPARDFLLETPWRIIIPNPNVNSHSL
jgi:hypothetical protein